MVVTRRNIMSSYYYKYLPNLDSCINVAHGKLKFSPIPTLNDPSELFPVVDIDEVKCSCEQLKKTGYSDDDFNWLLKQEKLLKKLAPMQLAVSIPKTKEQAMTILRSNFYDQLPLLENLLKITSKIMIEQTGILCVSERFDSFPMWAHYANNAKGFVVEFENLEKSFLGDDTGILNELKRVTYSDKRKGMSFIPDSHVNMFFSKLNDWSYEKEHRVVMALCDCEEVNSNNIRFHIHKIEESRISRILVGWNSSADDEKKLREHFLNIKHDSFIKRISLKELI